MAPVGRTLLLLLCPPVGTSRPSNQTFTYSQRVTSALHELRACVVEPPASARSSVRLRRIRLLDIALCRQLGVRSLLRPNALRRRRLFLTTAVALGTRPPRRVRREERLIRLAVLKLGLYERVLVTLEGGARPVGERGEDRRGVRRGAGEDGRDVGRGAVIVEDAEDPFLQWCAVRV